MAPSRGLLQGCIADDFTGATDLANTLVRNGMRTIQIIGVPDGRPMRYLMREQVAELRRRLPTL
ncbi:MAG: four-carbon acid sugar kinase family protein [Dongiaceae bacterium]